MKLNDLTDREVRDIGESRYRRRTSFIYKAFIWWIGLWLLAISVTRLPALTEVVRSYIALVLFISVLVPICVLTSRVTRAGKEFLKDVRAKS